MCKEVALKIRTTIYVYIVSLLKTHTNIRSLSLTNIENIRSMHDNSRPILGLFDKTSLVNTHRGLQGRVEDTLKKIIR